MIITESGMDFGPFEETDVCYIEQSNLYQQIKENVHMVEFILKKNDSLIFIEAKSSSPRQLKVSTEIIRNDKTEEVEYPTPYILEICNKLTNALNLFLSANLKCIEDEDNQILSFVDFTNIENYKMKFYLIINGHEVGWLTAIQDILQKELLAQSKIWKIEVKVLNDDIARQYQLIS